ncbi:MAG: C_GCAxxG_C_C family protein [Lentisphaeria bacterium]|nr:C_GCAxxG_C_C family protein [Lentisphaeria bacterium]
MSENISKADLSEKYFKEGANCAQAVLAAFAPELGIDVGFAMRLASGFGGGVGRMREVCGAFSGLVLIENLKNSSPDHTDKEAKDSCYARIQMLAQLFKEQSGGNSIICRELLSGTRATSGGASEERTKEFYKKRPCVELVRIAAKIAEKECFFEKNYKKPLEK